MKKILSALGVATLVIMGVASANTMVSGEANTHRCTTGYTWSDQAEGCIKAGAS
jgi:hypothetical protein